MGTSLDIVYQALKYLLKIRPASNNNHIGIASKTCEITSGGVNNMPIKNEQNITYGRLEANFPTLIKFDLTNIIVATGISNDTPKAKKSLSIKLR